MIHVICFSCRKEDHAYCVNEEKGTVTWCGCQHETGVILQAKDCQHLKAEPAQCPTCGKVMHLNDKEYSVVECSPKESQPKPDPIDPKPAHDPIAYQAKQEEIRNKYPEYSKRPLPTRIKKTPSS